MAITTSFKRVFSGTQAPFLPWLANFLITRYQHDTIINSGSALVALPGGNAMRRLLELLVLEAERLRKVLVPPQIMTTGTLVERLLPPAGLPASESSRMLAWVEALQTVAPELLSVLVPQLPERDNFRAWLSLAERIDQLHLEISGAGLFFSDVATRGAQLASFLDEERWQVLEQIAQTYQEILNTQGSACLYLDRLRRLAEPTSISVPGELFLAGVVDLNQNTRDLLLRCRGDLTALVFAAEEHGDAFDEFGALRITDGETIEVQVQDQQLTVVESPRDLVGALYDSFRHLGGTYARTDITVGVGDESETGYLKGSLSELGVAVRSANGTRFLETPAGFFMAVAAQYLNSRTFSHFSALIRHPFFSEWLARREAAHTLPISEMLSLVDLYQEHHYQAIISQQMPQENKNDALAIEIVEQLNILLLPLLGPALSVSQWATHIASFMENIALSLESESQEALEALAEIIQELTEAPSPLVIKGADALQLLLSQVDKRARIPDVHNGGIELLGWLELALDDAPALILTSIDEGIVPSVINADPFLPNTLRTHLGLTDNTRRLARDTYLLSTMLSSKANCSCIVTRRTLSGDPRFPSRLLLSCPRQELPDRISLLYQDGLRIQVERNQPQTISKEFLLTEPEKLPEPIVSMTVSAFRDYAACPYRFYLKHIARVRACGDDQVELDAMNFGILAHQVLYLSAKNQQLQSHDPEIIFKLFDTTLTNLAHAKFGTHEFPAIRVQIEQLRERLRHFSRWQAIHMQQGWKIFAVEKDFPAENCLLKLEEGAIEIRGRFDRIDYHQQKKRYLILDYKTGDKGQNIEQVLKKESWSDLQIPLYLHAARSILPEAYIDFAYVNLSAQLTHDQVIYFEDQHQALENGIEQARSIATRVHAGIFWPPAEKVSFDAYDWVLGLNAEDTLDSVLEAAHED